MWSLPNPDILVFNSLEFIFLIFPVFFLIYAIVPRRFFLYVLLGGSLLLYGMAQPVYIGVLLAVLLINYVLARLMGAFPAWRRLFLMLAVISNFGILIYFKYFHLSGAMPLGISFYTFRIVGYEADVCGRKVKPERSLVRLGAFVAMFPTVTSGPITRYDQMRAQLYKRRVSVIGLEEGLKTFVIGLGYKVLLADRIGILWNEIQIIGFESISTPLAWMGAFAYSFMLYFDFQGYSLMAAGVGRMLGFSLPDNFNHPYSARSFSQFWRRWHISLSSWFRDYVYIPLGGNRKGLARTCLNLLIVWAATGIWHGNHWNFILWGVFTCFLLVLERLFLKRPLEGSRFFSHIYMALLVPVTWIVFAITDLKELAVYLTRLFPVWELGGGVINPSDYIRYGRTFGILFLACVVFSQPWFARLYQKTKSSILWVPVLAAVFWICIYYLVNASSNPFLYFSF